MMIIIYIYILDLYFTTYPRLVKSCYTVPGISDHHMVVVDCDVKPRYKKQKHRKLYIYKKANWTNIKSNLRALIMYITHSPSSVETKWQDLREGIFTAMSHDIPTNWSSNRSHLPWLSSKLINCIKKKHKLMQLDKRQAFLQTGLNINSTKVSPKNKLDKHIGIM